MDDDPRPMHPPLDFACYVPVGDWATSWLEFFDGQQGRAVWAVTLGFARDGVNFYVKTIPRARYDRLMSTGPADTLLSVAEDATLLLVNYGLAAGAGGHGPITGARQRLTNRIPILVENVARAYRDWQQFTAEVDGSRALFRIYEFGGWWSAFSDAPGDRYIICHGNGDPPREFSLTTAGELGHYADGLDRPFGLNLLESPDQQARRGISKVRLPLHPDYERLLATV